MKSFIAYIAEAKKVALTKWKRVGNDGEEEISFPTRKFRLEKQYTQNDRHKGEWRIMEWDKDYKRWEWYETYSPKWYAKEQVMKMGQQ